MEADLCNEGVEKAFRKALEKLDKRRRKIVEDIVINKRPMAEIASEIGVSVSRISQLYGEACEAMAYGGDFMIEDKDKRRGERIKKAFEARPKSGSLKQIIAGTIASTPVKFADPLDLPAEEPPKEKTPEKEPMAEEAPQKESKPHLKEYSVTENTILALLFGTDERDQALKNAIKEMAQKERRSLCNQILHMLEEATLL